MSQAIVATATHVAVVVEKRTGVVRHLSVRPSRDEAVEALLDWMVGDDVIRSDDDARTEERPETTRGEMAATLAGNRHTVSINSGLDLAQIVPAE